MKISKSIVEEWRRSLLKKWLITLPNKSGNYIALFLDKEVTVKQWGWTKNSPIDHFLYGYIAEIGSGINIRIDMVSVPINDLNYFVSLFTLKEEKLLDKLNRLLAKKMLRMLHMSDNELSRERKMFDLELIQPEDEF